MLISRPCKHAPLHKQVALHKWKQPIYDSFVPLREFYESKKEQSERGFG